MSKNNASTVAKKEDDGYFGLYLALCFLLFGSFSFLGWENLGPEILMKMLGMFFVFLGVIGLGVEFTNKIKNDGPLELAIGLSLSLSILMLRSTFEWFPNILLLIIGIIAFFAVILSITRLIKQYHANELFKNAIIQGNVKSFYKWLLILGEICGAIVSFYNLFEILFLK